MNNKIKATVHYTNDADCSVEIRVEDGGVAYIYHNGEHYITEYYQNRCYEDEVDYDALAEGKKYLNDWDESKEHVDMEMVEDALNWLVVATKPFEFEIREYVNTNPPNIAKRHSTERV